MLPAREYMCFKIEFSPKYFKSCISGFLLLYTKVMRATYFKVCICFACISFIFYVFIDDKVAPITGHSFKAK